MKLNSLTGSTTLRFAVMATMLAIPACARALNGDVGIHDPSTITYDDGKYYVYGTGGGPLVSDDGWTWRRGALAHGSGARRDPHRRQVLHVHRARLSAAEGRRNDDLEQVARSELARLQVE